MIEQTLLLICAFGVLCSAESSIFPYDLKVEFLENPLAVDSLNPQLSWKLGAERLNYNLSQSAYQVLAASDSSLLFQKPDLYDSGKVNSDSTVGVRYEGKTPEPGRRVYWTVRVWDQNDKDSKYAFVSFWDVGLNVSNWGALWIAAPGRLQREALNNLSDEDKQIVSSHNGLKPVLYFRKTFTVDSDIKSAKAYATSKGLYDLFINDESGVEMGGHKPLFSPGWTDYSQSFQYQVYDVTHLIGRENVIGAMVGTGWYAGYVGWYGKYGHWGQSEAFLLELHIELKNGSQIIIKTDDSWKVTTGPFIYSDLLQGNLYYENRSLNNWLNFDYNDTTWHAVDHNAINTTVSLVAERSTPIIELDYFDVQNAWQSSPGVWVYDVGRNFAGYVRIRLENFTSTARIQVRHAEVLNPDGSIYTLNLRTARATETYLLNDPKKRNGTLILKPHFTYHGLRYIEVTGYPTKLDFEKEISGVRIGIKGIRSGIKTDNEMVTTLSKNIVNTQLSNFMSVPTDCAQRDERLGWMGDAAMFSLSSIYNGDVSGFFTKWMRDIREAQSSTGDFSSISPRVVLPLDGGPIWADAGVIVPYNVFRMYGDIQTLKDNYEAMHNYLSYLIRRNPTFIWDCWVEDNNFYFGDWLNVNESTSKLLLATAYFGYDAMMMSQMARALGKTSDAEEYSQLHSNISKAFVKEFVDVTTGRILNDTQTGYLLALAFKLLPSDVEPKAAGHLVENIKRHDWHVTTGFVGVGQLLPVLCDHGYTDVAYKLLLQTTYPSWGYMIKNNATTVWEHWDGWTEENGFQNASMNSFNQYALGSVGRWLYQYMAGIDTDEVEAGFKRINIKPHIGHGVNESNASYDSVRGRITVNWKVAVNTFNLTVDIPVNTDAIITLPFLKKRWIKKVPSGEYHFSVPLE